VFDKGIYDVKSCAYAILASGMCFGIPILVMILTAMNVDLGTDPVRFGGVFVLWPFL
jgi:hypothetical protein